MGRKNHRRRIEVWMFVKDPGKLRRRRKDKRLSQKNLADLVGCTQQYISLMENGDDRDCSEKVAEKIARFLDLELEDLFETRTVSPMPAVASSQSVGGEVA